MNQPTDRRHQDEHRCRTDGPCCCILDPNTRVPLEPYGAPGLEVAETVNGHGNRQLWIVDAARIGEPIDHGNPKPSHETGGRLPAEIRDRIWGPALRCGRATTSGKPCRARVAQPGAACTHHRAVPTCESTA